MNADGTNKKTILRRGRNSTPSWSPDASQIVFVSDLKGQGVYIANSDGSGVCKLAPLIDSQFLYTSMPTWSPAPMADGQYWIAYSDRLGGGIGPYDLFMIPAKCPATTQPVNLTNGTFSVMYGATWSPWADRLAVYRGAEIYVLYVGIYNGRPAITSQINLTQFQPFVDTYAESPDWARGEEKLAIIGWPAGDTSGVKIDLWALDVNNPAYSTKLTSTPGRYLWPTWSPDDQEIAYTFQESLNSGTIYIHKLNTATGAVVSLGTGRYPDWRRCFRVCPPDKPGCQLCK